MKKLRIVIGGFIGLYPTGGVTWDYIQYPVGLHLLGHEVFYIEDTMQYSRYQLSGEKWDDATQSIGYLKKAMELFGLEEKWAYRDIGSGMCYGMSLAKVEEICRTADVFINVSAATFLRDDYLRIPKRVLIDSDPMFTQVQDWDDADPKGSYEKIKARYQWYNCRFTFGQNMGKPDCKVPDLNLQWHCTRQPVCLEYWKQSHHMAGGPTVFSTVMNWSAREPMIYQQQTWGQKDIELLKYISIPSLFKQANFRIVMALSQKENQNQSIQALTKEGWSLLCPVKTIRDPQKYQQFIMSSSAEFSVAKEAYVKSKSGWFSCRSACYLAAGKPVVTQDTGWSCYIPSGKGLLGFHDLSSATEAVREATSSISKHSRAAREIAVDFFESGKVLKQLLETVALNDE